MTEIGEGEPPSPWVPCHCLCPHVLNHFSCVWLFATPWTITHQVPLSLGFFRQEYWRGLPFTSPGNLPNPGIKLASPLAPALQQRLYCWTLPSWSFLRPVPRWFSCNGSPGRSLCTFAITTVRLFPHNSVLWRLDIPCLRVKNTGELLRRTALHCWVLYTFGLRELI